jgi:group I intron endonuclease
MGYVYQATCRDSGKRYIGKALCSLHERRCNHIWSAKRGDSRYAFHSAIRKYGESSFDWTILYESEYNSALCEMECFFISYFDTKCPKGYNMTDGGEGVPGHVITSETRARMSASHQGRKMSPESIEKSAAAKRGRKRGTPSAECRAKLSAALSGRQFTPEHCLHLSQAKTGKSRGPLSPESVAKRSATVRGRKHSQEWCANIGAAVRGKKRTPEQCARISASQKARWTAKRTQIFPSTYMS